MTGNRIVLSVAVMSPLLALALAGCGDEGGTDKLSAEGESCVETGDCSEGLVCAALTCVASRGDSDTSGEPDGRTDTAAVEPDAGTVPDSGPGPEPCIMECVYGSFCDKVFGGVLIDGDCAGPKDVCCNLEAAPECGSPYECLSAIAMSCELQGGTIVAPAWCGTPEKNCCDLSDAKMCEAPAECIDTSNNPKGCSDQGGTHVVGACAGETETCCALLPCEAPNECVAPKGCAGEVAPYACANPKDVCCEPGGEGGKDD